MRRQRSSFVVVAIIEISTCRPLSRMSANIWTFGITMRLPPRWCMTEPMRSTVTLAPDTARAVEELRRAEGLEFSEAVNELVRRGLMPRTSTTRFIQRTEPMGLRIDVSDVPEALDSLDPPPHSGGS